MHTLSLPMISVNCSMWVKRSRHSRFHESKTEKVIELFLKCLFLYGILYGIGPTLLPLWTVSKTLKILNQAIRFPTTKNIFRKISKNTAIILLNYDLQSLFIKMQQRKSRCVYRFLGHWKIFCNNLEFLKLHVFVGEKFLDKSSNFFTVALRTVVLGHL